MVRKFFRKFIYALMATVTLISSVGSSVSIAVAEEIPAEESVETALTETEGMQVDIQNAPEESETTAEDLAPAPATQSVETEQEVQVSTDDILEGDAEIVMEAQPQVSMKDDGSASSSDPSGQGSTDQEGNSGQASSENAGNKDDSDQASDQVNLKAPTVKASDETVKYNKSATVSINEVGVTSDDTGNYELTLSVPENVTVKDISIPSFTGTEKIEIYTDENILSTVNASENTTKIDVDKKGVQKIVFKTKTTAGEFSVKDSIEVILSNNVSGNNIETFNFVATSKFESGDKKESKESDAVSVTFENREKDVPASLTYSKASYQTGENIEANIGGLNSQDASEAEIVYEIPSGTSFAEVKTVPSFQNAEVETSYKVSGEKNYKTEEEVNALKESGEVTIEALKFTVKSNAVGAGIEQTEDFVVVLTATAPGENATKVMSKFTGGDETDEKLAESTLKIVSQDETSVNLTAPNLSSNSTDVTFNDTFTVSANGALLKTNEDGGWTYLLSMDIPEGVVLKGVVIPVFTGASDITVLASDSNNTGELGTVSVSDETQYVSIEKYGLKKVLLKSVTNTNSFSMNGSVDFIFGNSIQDNKVTSFDFQAKATANYNDNVAEKNSNTVTVNIANYVAPETEKEPQNKPESKPADNVNHSHSENNSVWTGNGGSGNTIPMNPSSSNSSSSSSNVKETEDTTEEDEKKENAKKTALAREQALKERQKAIVASRVNDIKSKATASAVKTETVKKVTGVEQMYADWEIKPITEGIIGNVVKQMIEPISEKIISNPVPEQVGLGPEL